MLNNRLEDRERWTFLFMSFFIPEMQFLTENKKYKQVTGEIYLYILYEKLVPCDLEWLGYKSG